MFENSVNLNCKARKEHRCKLCGEMINKGEMHASYTNYNNGYYSTVKYHQKCEAIAGKNSTIL